jgi:hypothetical protein
MSSKTTDRVMHDLDRVIDGDELTPWESAQIVRASMQRLANDTTRTDCAMWKNFLRLYDAAYPEEQ